MTPHPTPSFQASILAPVPDLGRFLVFDIASGAAPLQGLMHLRDGLPADRVVVGIGQPLARALGVEVPGLRACPVVNGPGCAFPSTQGALWAFVAGSESGDMHDRASSLVALLGDAFVLREEVATFRYQGGRDLSGYEDGTENPKDDLAVAAAIIAGRSKGLDGGSFVAEQRWVHDLARFSRLSEAARDATIGRNRVTNEELPDAPPSAHVKRSAQETFEPSAFMVRRSMPWGGVGENGLYFVAYGESLDRFERVLRRMAGLDDGIVDGLLTLSRPVTGGYYFCPPVGAGRLDLTALGVDT